VLTAADAETGLTLARSELPSLILMDVQLPGMDGLEATALRRRTS
jgi:two-component system cell cycle response regulator DivK